ncbi:MAG: preprotein translocase subunit SecA [Bacteroidales bacterium]|jgi:preprotein translocase subunit SecA|nr:preprotein translocase subunit SecA [Bacteroidales bacterium]
MLGFLKNLIGTKAERDLKAIKPYIQKIHAVYPQIEKLSNDELRQKTVEFKSRIAEAIRKETEEIDELKKKVNSLEIEQIDDREGIWQQIDKIEKEAYEKTQTALSEILPEAFSVVKETAKRFTENEWVEVMATEMDRELSATCEDIVIQGDKARYHNSWLAGGTRLEWNMVHYDVQLIGGVVLHEGKIAEMATGEGKTLVATLPVYLNALPGKGVHIVTVNDYLAKRDSEWMGMLYQFHGLRTDCIDKHRPNSVERRNAYKADITYGTNNEFGFDYLRDNMTSDPDEMVQRKHNYAIVDEVDSVLIDEARTPLIISGPTAKGDEQEFDNYKPIVEKLYTVQKNLVTKLLADAKNILKDENVSNEDEKQGGILLLRAHHGLPKTKPLIKFLSEPGKRSLLQKTENFYLQNQAKDMYIINDELYFVIDEKNNSIELTEKGINFVNELVGDVDFYHLPDVGSEIAEIEKFNISDAEKTERKSVLMQEFSIKSERVHSVNQLLRAYAMFEKDVEYVIIDNKIKIVDEKTGRIMEGRRYSDGLHQAIEAKENVKVEAATQTYATITLQNYFRMYNKLAGMTGTAETEAGEFWNIYKLDVVVIPTNRPIQRHDREDIVYKTAREKYNAVIDGIEKLVHAGRPVLVGTTSVENSELLSRMLMRKGLKHNVLNAKMHQKEAEIVAEAGQSGAITIATNMAGRGTDIKLGVGVKEAGGLAIIGTERHDSRRVDRQLRGRSGRQGDPGSSQFFVSLEDDLMRMFGSERIAGIMDRLGLKEGEMIQHPMISKSIERAQKKVEENNFGIRKRLLEYDDVMNSQRDVIYKRRQHALFGERLALDLQNMIYDVCENLISENLQNRDYEGVKYSLLSSLAIESPFDEKEFLDGKVHILTDRLFDVVYQEYLKKRNSIADRAHPLIKHVFENQKQYENILIPFVYGKKQYPVIANLAKAYDNKLEIPMAMEKSVSLAIIDDSWKEHLREMDDLKQSVQNASYEQKDPLVIYKLESFGLFKNMIQTVNKEIVTFLLRCDLPNIQTAGEASVRQVNKQQAKMERKDMLSQAHSDTQQDQRQHQPIKVEKTVGRNELCPCGSGKKFKHCHGKS